MLGYNRSLIQSLKAFSFLYVWPQELKQTEDCTYLTEDRWHAASQSRHHLRHKNSSFLALRNILLDDSHILAQYFIQILSEKT